MNKAEALKIRNAILEASGSLSDEVASTVPDLFDNWEPYTNYIAGNRRKYNNVLYKCLLSHQSLSTWTPDVSPSLWARADNPAEEWPEWVQPLGSTDAYSLGAKVSHNNKHWVSSYSNNVWEPGVFGWDENT